MYDPNEECKAMIAAINRLCEQKNMSPYALAKEAVKATFFDCSRTTIYAKIFAVKFHKTIQVLLTVHLACVIINHVVS